MDLGIKNKRVLISGASNGIGKELAFQFAKEGCKLTLIARNKLKLKSITKKIGGKKKGHHFFDVNLLPTGNGTEISKKILKKLGVHEIIVHCVGGGLGVDDPFAKYTDWLKIWRFNVGIAIEINNVFIFFYEIHPKQSRRERIVEGKRSLRAREMREGGRDGKERVSMKDYCTYLDV